MKKAFINKALIVIVLCTITQVSLFAEPKESKKPRELTLSPGSSVSGVINLSPDSPWYKTYRIEVPADAFGIRLSLSDAPADLDLFIKYGQDIVSYDDVSAYAVQDDYNEVLFTSRLQDPPLQTGVYYVDVAYQLNTLPRVNGRLQSEVPFTLTYETVVAELAADLVTDSLITAALLPSEGMVKLFTIQVPPNPDAFRVDLFDTSGDLDLLVRRGEPAFNSREADLVGEWVMSRESVIWRNFPEEPLEPGTYYITVVDQISNDAMEEFSIIASLSDEPAEALKALPFLTIPEDMLDRALLSTLEIISEGGTGSGCLVSGKGLVLTNYHVVRGFSGRPSDLIYGAVTLDPSTPPVELFRMEVLEYDTEKDLALLRVSSGFYGQPLPFGYRFPYYELGDADRLVMGQPLTIIGYPGIGGTGSRTSVSITKGIVSGFQRTPFGTIIKTDAEINGGNSGGAAINAYYELVGLPTMVVNEDAGQMGFIHPVNLLPKEWVDLIERD